VVIRRVARLGAGTRGDMMRLGPGPALTPRAAPVQVTAQDTQQVRPAARHGGEE